jgi:hypothetical protein
MFIGHYGPSFALKTAVSRIRCPRLLKAESGHMGLAGASNGPKP